MSIFGIKTRSIQPTITASQKQSSSRLFKQRNTVKISDYEGVAKSIMRNHLPIPHFSPHRSSTKLKKNNNQWYAIKKLNSFLSSLKFNGPTRNLAHFTQTEKMVSYEYVDFANSIFLPDSHHRGSVDNRRGTYNSNKVLSRNTINLNSTFAYKPRKTTKFNKANDFVLNRTHTSKISKEIISKKHIMQNEDYFIFASNLTKQYPETKPPSQQPSPDQSHTYASAINITEPPPPTGSSSFKRKVIFIKLNTQKPLTGAN
jgi:hypothetical protein